MRSLLSTLTLGLLWVQWVTALDELLTKSWTLSHSFHGGPDATIRGKITLSIANGVVDLQLDTDEHCLSRNAVETLWESGWYQLQLREDGDSQAPVIRTSVPACQLVRANFRDQLVLTFGSNGKVISMAYQPLVSPLASSTCEKTIPPDLVVPDTFQSKLEYETAVPGMTLRTILPSYNPPPGLVFLTGNGASSSPHNPAARGSASSRPPPGVFGEDHVPPEVAPEGLFGYLRKYWYIVVPLMLLNLMNSSAAPTTGEAEGDGVAAAASTVAGAATAGAAAPSQSRARRGKRG
jgi:hypothetical protein